MKSFFLFTFFIFSSILSIAQIEFEKRLEFELKDGYSGEKIIAFGENGFLLRSVSDEVIDGKSEWKYDLYNTNLELEKTHSIHLHKKYYADESYNTDERMHTLFKTSKGMYTLISIDAATLKETKVEGQLPKKTWVKEMAIIGDYAYFHASMKKSKYLFSLNWKTGKQNLIPIDIENYKSKRLSITHFQVMEKSKEVFLYVKAFEGKDSDIFIIRLNDKGEKQDMYKLTQDIEKKIVSVSASNVGNNKYIFTGTYSSKFSTLSEGLFFCEAEKGKINFIEYYNFLDLNNFLSYLPEKKQAKIERKKKRKKSKGKELKINYRIAEHPIIQTDNGYMFLGEAYYATYRTEYYTAYVNGKPVQRTRRVFDGYQFTHAVLARFDQQGKMIWDQTFQMWPSYKPFYAKRFISLAGGTQEAINLVFANNSRIVSKSFDFDGTIKNDKTSEPIETNFEGDKAKWTFSNIDYWYDNYFLAYGNQKIKNKEEKGVKKKRKIYFISKIKY